MATRQAAPAPGRRGHGSSALPPLLAGRGEARDPGRGELESSAGLFACGTAWGPVRLLHDDGIGHHQSPRDRIALGRAACDRVNARATMPGWRVVVSSGSRHGAAVLRETNALDEVVRPFATSVEAAARRPFMARVKIAGLVTRCTILSRILELLVVVDVERVEPLQVPPPGPSFLGAVDTGP